LLLEEGFHWVRKATVFEFTTEDLRDQDFSVQHPQSWSTQLQTSVRGPSDPSQPLVPSAISTTGRCHGTVGNIVPGRPMAVALSMWGPEQSIPSIINLAFWVPIPCRLAANWAFTPQWQRSCPDLMVAAKAYPVRSTARAGASSLAT